jgi:hypothetical protein
LAAYCAGISAEAAGRYENLANVLRSRVVSSEFEGSHRNLSLAMIDGTSNLVKELKILPEYKNKHVPRSEYLFTLLQSELDELFYLEGDYELNFDRFEVLLALEYAHLNLTRGRERVWGPPGRFAWKFQRRGEDSPFHQIIAEADKQGDNWSPIRAGLFGGSAQRFKEISTQYGELIAGMGLH